MQVLNHRIEVKGFKFLGIVEPFAPGVGQAGVPVKNRDVQGVRPPFAVPAPARAVRYRALRRACYGLPIVGDGRRCLFCLFFHLFILSFKLEYLAGARRGAHLVHSPRKMSSHSRSTRLPSEAAAGRGTSYHSKSSTLPQRSQMKW